MSSTDTKRGEFALNDIFAFKWRPLLRAAVAAVLVFVIFVKLCEFFVVGSDPFAAASVIVGPDDFVSVMRICLIALGASAVGTLVCRDSSSRPMVAALALGVIFLKLDTSAIWEQVGAVAGYLRPPDAEEMTALSGHQLKEWEVLVAAMRHHHFRLYSVYYMVYALWTVAILYSGYVGQYVTGRLILRRKDARTESAIYVAENAGVGLAASALSGGIAILVMVGFTAFLGRDGAVHGGSPAASTVEEAQSSDEGVAGGSAAETNASAPPEEAEGPAATPARPAALRHSDLRTLWGSRAYGLFVVLAFFTTAYITALLVRPRTSTWVACGAILGVMLLPGSTAVALYVVTPQELGESPWLTSVLVPFSRLMRSLSPFALTALGISAALAGDWVGKQLVAYTRRRQSIQVYKPL